MTADPFTLGVASGEPTPDGFVLWTRLAPAPLAGGGMPSRPVPVEWELAADESMCRIIRRGVVTAVPADAHSVHVELAGLEPDTWYWYRFRTAGHLSRTGRTRTWPVPSASPARIRFAVTSCQAWEDGFWAAYHGMAAETVDFVLHLGDYIYEDGAHPDRPRQQNSPPVRTLSEYRNRHALYKSDPALQEAHACSPWLVTMDDHEVEDNFAGLMPKDPTEATGFPLRRAAAYQAFWEHLPLRERQRPDPAGIRLYRRATFGDLLEVSVLDTRTFRSDQPCGDGFRVRCPQALRPSQTMTGPEQERWLLEGLDRSRARWNVIGQQVMFAQMNWLPGAGELYNMDQWDGYVAARDRLLGSIYRRRLPNPVVLSGDTHSAWAIDLKADWDDPGSPTLGTELISHSLSSRFPAELRELVFAALPKNPHVRYFDATGNGYLLCEVTTDRLLAEFRTVTDVLDPAASMTTTARFVVHNGHPGAQPA